MNDFDALAKQLYDIFHETANGEYIGIKGDYTAISLDGWFNFVEVARRLRAALQGEPVAWCCEWSNGEKNIVEIKPNWWVVGWHTGNGHTIKAVYPLYAAPASDHPASQYASGLEQAAEKVAAAQIQPEREEGGVVNSLAHDSVLSGAQYDEATIKAREAGWDSHGRGYSQDRRKTERRDLWNDTPEKLRRIKDRRTAQTAPTTDTPRTDELRVLLQSARSFTQLCAVTGTFLTEYEELERDLAAARAEIAELKEKL